MTSVTLIHSCSSRQSYIVHAFLRVYACICLLFVCLLFWVYLTAGGLTLCFSSIQGDWFEQQPVVGPATGHFCRAFLASVSVGVSRCCLQSTGFEWKCWMWVCVCSFECIWQLFALTSNACWAWRVPQDGMCKHHTRTTDRHSRLISVPLRYGWAAVGTCMHIHLPTAAHTWAHRSSTVSQGYAPVHVFVLISFLSFGENTVVYLFLVYPLLWACTTAVSTHARAHADMTRTPLSCGGWVSFNSHL
jgi:hypothetical protein